MVEERIDRTAGSDRRGIMPPTGFFFDRLVAKQINSEEKLTKAYSQRK